MIDGYIFKDSKDYNSIKVGQLMLVTNAVEISKLKVHPRILSIIPMGVLMGLVQDLVSTSTMRSTLSLPITVVVKKGMRKNSSYLVVQNMLNYLTGLQLEMSGESVQVPINIIESVDIETIENQFFLELLGYKHSSFASGVIAASFKKLEENRSQEKRPYFAKPSIKDIAHRRSHTIREISGFDGRSFRNTLRAKDKFPEETIEFINQSL